MIRTRVELLIAVRSTARNVKMFMIRTGVDLLITVISTARTVKRSMIRIIRQ